MSVEYQAWFLWAVGTVLAGCGADVATRLMGTIILIVGLIGMWL